MSAYYDRLNAVRINVFLILFIRNFLENSLNRYDVTKFFLIISIANSEKYKYNIISRNSISNSSQNLTNRWITSQNHRKSLENCLKIIESSDFSSRVERNRRNIRRALPDARILKLSIEASSSSHAVHHDGQASLVSLEFANTRGLSMHNELHAYSSARNQQRA